MIKRYTQAQFDSACINYLLKEKKAGKSKVQLLSKDLHDAIVAEASYNGMPMTCNAMWKVYDLIGGKVIYASSKKQSPKLEIEYKFAK